MNKAPLLVSLCVFLPLLGCFGDGSYDPDDPGGGDGSPSRSELISFKGEVVPILEARACQVCHTKKEEGSDEGELTLDTKDKKIYEEIVEEVSPNYGVPRVDLDDPDSSLILLMPLGDPNHKVGVFRGTDDPDYRVLLRWIEQGAPEK